MKVALITYYAVTNIGDRILTDVVSWMLKNNGHSVSIIDINARYPYKFNGVMGNIEKQIVKRFIKRNTKEEREQYFRSALNGADYILFGGGQILEPASCVVNENIGIITQIAEEKGIPVSYNAVGFFRAKSEPLCNDLKQSFEYKNLIFFTFREPLEQFVNPSSFKSTTLLKKVCDSAVWCCEAYGINRRTRENTRVVGINVIYADAFNLSFIEKPVELIEDTYVSIYEKLTAKGYDCYFFTNGVHRDRLTLNNIQQKLSLPETRIKVPDKVNSGKAFVNFLNQFDFIISSRLHTSICSYSLKIPTLALSWDSKIDEFYKQIGMKKSVFHIEADVSRIVEEIDVASYTYPDTYDTYRKTIVNSIPGLI